VLHLEFARGVSHFIIFNLLSTLLGSHPFLFWLVFCQTLGKPKYFIGKDPNLQLEASEIRSASPSSMSIVNTSLLFIIVDSHGRHFLIAKQKELENCNMLYIRF
jgi:hypothetical protein